MHLNDKNMQKITPFLWFDNQAEEAMNFYISIFNNARIINASRMGPEGPVMTATFQLEGQEFYVLNGGPMYKFTEAISLFVTCETQQEVDEKWEKLSNGGEERQCGWVKDKFGLFWQIIPNALGELLGGNNPQRSKRVFDAMLKMNKIIIKDLEEAYNG